MTYIATMTLRDRIMLHATLDRGTRCWVWTSCLTRDGYGQIFHEKKWLRAHRVAYELFRGTVPDGHELDHRCRNRACVNPSHLDPVTHGVNMERARNQRTHCVNGHEFTPENTLIETSRGVRRCRICRQRTNRAAEARRAKR